MEYDLGGARLAQTRSETIEIILARLVDLLGISGAFFAGRDDFNGDMVVELTIGALGRNLRGARLPPGETVLHQVQATGLPFTSPDIRRVDDALFRRISGTSPGALAAACIPLVDQSQNVGVLAVFRQTPIINGEHHLLTAIAEMAGGAIQRAALHEQTRQRLERISVLHAIDLAISSSLDLSHTLTVLVEQIIQNLQVDAADVLLLDPASNRLEYAAGAGFYTQQVHEARLRPGESYAGASALLGKTIHLRLHRKTGDLSFLSFCRQEHFAEYFCIPLILQGEIKGVLEIYHRHEQPAKQEWISYLETLAGQAVIALENALLFEESERANRELMAAYDKTIEGWSRAMDLRDKETEGHTQRVTEMSVKLARALGFDEAGLVQVRRGALLHDIGKIGVPDGILLKPSALSDSEMEQMRRHPAYAEEMLFPIEYLRPALEIPRCHHERWDGTGYPHGLAGEQIPLAARLFAVVDVYDALTSDRPYRAAWSAEQAAVFLHEQSGRHFDPAIVDEFLSLLATEKPGEPE